MIDLREQEHLALRLLVNAGAGGIALAEIGLENAMRLQLAGFASIQTVTPQNVVATEAGAAFSRRTAFA